MVGRTSFLPASLPVLFWCWSLPAPGGWGCPPLLHSLALFSEIAASPPVSGRGCRQRRMTTGTLNERGSVLGPLCWPQGRTYHLCKTNSPSETQRRVSIKGADLLSSSWILWICNCENEEFMRQTSTETGDSCYLYRWCDCNLRQNSMWFGLTPPKSRPCPEAPDTND